MKRMRVLLVASLTMNVVCGVYFWLRADSSPRLQSPAPVAASQAGPMVQPAREVAESPAKTLTSDEAFELLEKRNAARFSRPEVAGLDKMLDDPEFSTSFIDGIKGSQDPKYARLYRVLNGSPEQIEKLRDHFAQHMLGIYDTGVVVKDGSLPTEEKASAVLASSELDIAELAALGFSQDASQSIIQYQQTLPLRNQVDLLATRLSFSQEPLSDRQYESLVAALNADPVVGRRLNSAENRARAISPDFAMGIDAHTVEVARKVLSPGQAKTFEKIYREQARERSVDRRLQGEYSKYTK